MLRRIGQADSTGQPTRTSAARHYDYAFAYLARSLSRNFLLSAVTSQAFGQKHRSIVHQSCGTPLFCMAGISRSKLSLPVPNGLWVDVLCSLSDPSESIRWMWVILP